jgi:inosine-uridine nucleoside N-ribohydrolase
MVPLDVTHTALVTPAVLDRIHALKSPFANIVCEVVLTAGALEQQLRACS